MNNVALCSLAIGILYFSQAKADSILWSGQVSISGYSCKTSGKDEIVVHGAVTLISPDDVDPRKPPLKIAIVCDKITFEKDASLSSISSMDIRISKVASGPIKLTSLRGVDGKDAEKTPGIWGVTKMKHGDPVGAGPDGDNAQCKVGDSHDSSAGKTGPKGNDGEDGREYTAPKGANGQGGATASDIVFLTASFAPGSSIEVVANGGNGGVGGRGGRGADGGDAADGGIGGRGGNSCSHAKFVDTHSASDGGPGGPGGNGGHGGNGGPGGDGGPGGNGGSVTVGLLEGSGSFPTPVISNPGGIGGDPGLGGERGEGGKGGEGGLGGCGGSGNTGVIGLGGTPGGHCAGAGPAGPHGDPGDPGPIGLKGTDGDPGHIGDGFTGTLPKAVWQTLVPEGS